MLHSNSRYRVDTGFKPFSSSIFVLGENMFYSPPPPPPAATVPALADFAEFHVRVWDLLSPTLAGILRFNERQSAPSSGSVTITVHRLRFCIEGSAQSAASESPLRFKMSRNQRRGKCEERLESRYSSSSCKLLSDTRWTPVNLLTFSGGEDTDVTVKNSG